MKAQWLNHKVAIVYLWAGESRAAGRRSCGVAGAWRRRLGAESGRGGGRHYGGHRGLDLVAGGEEERRAAAVNWRPRWRAPTAVRVRIQRMGGA